MSTGFKNICVEPSITTMPASYNSLPRDTLLPSKMTLSDAVLSAVNLFNVWLK